MSLKLALSIQTSEIPQPLPLTLLKGSLDEKIDRAARLGIDGVELVTIDPEGMNRPAIRKKLADAKLRVAAVATGAMASMAGLTLLNADETISAEAFHRLEGCLRLAGDLEAPVVTVGSFRGRAGAEKENQIRRFAGLMRRAGDLAEGLGVRLALEPLNRYEMDFLNTVRETLEFLRQVDHPAVGVLVDTFHANIEESSRIEPFHQAWQAGKLFYIHIAENNRLAPGWGMIDFAQVVAELRRIGYDGYLTAELLAQPDAEAAAEQTVSFMRPLLPPTKPE